MCFGQQCQWDRYDRRIAGARHPDTFFANFGGVTLTLPPKSVWHRTQEKTQLNTTTERKKQKLDIWDERKRLRNQEMTKHTGNNQTDKSATKQKPPEATKEGNMIETTARSTQTNETTKQIQATLRSLNKGRKKELNASYHDQGTTEQEATN